MRIDTPTSPRLKFLLRKYIMAGQKCVLCRKSAVYGACFIPDDPHLYSPTPPRAGKLRLLFYALCDICQETEGVCDHVEDLLKERQVHNIHYISNEMIDAIAERDFRDLKEKNKDGK